MPVAEANFGIDKFQAANLYSLLYALEYLERAYIGGYSSIKGYEDECSSLLSLCKVLDDATPQIFETFSKAYGLNYALALNRIKNGKPAESKTGQYSHRGEKLLMIELSEHFITLIDALKLGNKGVDELYPLVHELVTCIETGDFGGEADQKLSDLEFMEAIYAWHKRLKSMQASEELPLDDARQFAMEIEAGYSSLKSHLRSNQ